ncbi:MAG: hypothetical protein U0872_08505 [Planctomycetaceae bacterium]
MKHPGIFSNWLPADEGRLRAGKVQPYGMDTPVLVELLPPYGDECELTADHVRQYETGVESFLEGRWEDAYRRLHQMPANAPRFSVAAHHGRQSHAPGGLGRSDSSAGQVKQYAIGGSRAECVSGGASASIICVEMFRECVDNRPSSLKPPNCD